MKVKAFKACRVEYGSVKEPELCGFYFVCPGCGWKHHVYTEWPNRRGAKWTFNGNPNAPTFSPSIMYEYGEGGANNVCHSLVTEGRIQFLGDCTHALKNQTVTLPDMPSE